MNEKTSFESPRASSDYYYPWEKCDVINFLEERLGLNKNNKLKGRICEKHQGSFYFWKEQIAKKALKTPFEVIHIDSHMDLGCVDNSWRII